MKLKKNKLGALAITQSLILVVSILAMAFMVGTSIEVVSAAEEECIALGGTCNTYPSALANGAQCSANGKSGTVKTGLCPGDEKTVCCVLPLDVGGCDGNEDCETGERCIINVDNPSEGICVDANPNQQFPSEQDPSVSKTKTEQGKSDEESGLTLNEALGTVQGINGGAEIVQSLFAGKEAGATISSTAIETAVAEGTTETIVVGSTGQASSASILTYFTTGYNSGFTTATGEILYGAEAVAANGGAIAPSGFGAVVGNVFNTIAVAFGAAQLVILAADLLGAGERNMQSIKTAAYTSAAVAAAGAIGLTYIAGGVAILGSTAGPPGWLVAAVVVVATAIYMAFSYQDFSQEVFTYQPQVWKPQDGGEDCELCNDFRYGCGEYQCRSLGNACELVNVGTEDEMCTWINENDIKGPILTPLESALKSEDYMYIDSTATLPGERGAKVVYKPNNDGCVPPFTSVSFGVASDEPAECMVDVLRKPNMSDMAGHMAEGPVSVYNHTLEIPASGMPSQEALEGVGWELETENNYTFFIRCKDTNGNPTIANFLMEFCVEKGPDTQAPIIEGTNYLQQSYVGYNQSSVPLEVYTNEPADCRWDFQDLNYEMMNNEMDDCSQNLHDYYIINTFTYGCSSTLTGIQEGESNQFFIKCKDKPWLEGLNETLGKRYANKDPYVLTLKGTYPLQIDEVTINDEESGATIVDSTNTVKATLKVKTSAGANEGRAKCQYGIDGNFYDFYNDGNFEFLYENTQEFFLPQGYYNYEVKCLDEAGNSVQDTINFTIDIDEQAPIVTRIYYEENFLKVKTNEDATCVFGTDTCNYAYEDGIQMNDVDGFNHYVEWNTDVDLYIKCKDLFGNLPLPQNECSIIARAVEKEYY